MIKLQHSGVIVPPSVLYAREMQVSDDGITKKDMHGGGDRGFFSSLIRSIARDTVKFVVAFAVGTGAGAIVCWYYGIPLVFALLGGILVLAIALALMTDSWFS